MKKCTILFLVLALILSGCTKAPEQTPTGSAPAEVNTPTQSAGDYFSDRDFASGIDSSAVTITLTGASASCSDPSVTVDGSTVTVTAEGTYVLTGSLENGTVIVDTDKQAKVQLVLSGAAIHAETSAAIYIRQADKVFITLAEGTENTLSNGGSFQPIDDSNIDAAVFSKDDVTFNGAGRLTVTSPAGHGIVSKDSLTVTGGDYEISCAAHAMTGKDDVSIAGGSFLLTAGKDGIHAENADDEALGTVYISGGNFQITAEGDGISAAAALQIDGGSFTLTTGGGSENGTKASSEGWGGFPGGGPGGRGERPGGEQTAQDTTDSTSMKAIKAGTGLVITSGSFTIDSADDAVHSNGSMTVSGGTFTVATGDDGFHAEDTLTVTGGTITVTESYEGLEGLHILVQEGMITIVSSDDGLNAAGGTDQSGIQGGRDGMFGGGRPGGMGGDPGGMGGDPGGMSAGNGSVTISGGTVHITASGDGIDANGTLTISGGYTTVCGPTQGDTATLDYDTSAVITGGTFIGTGAAGMAQSFSDSTQGVIAVSTGNRSAGTRITLTDSSGKTLLDYTPALSFGVVILSSPELVKGESYTITVGDQSGTFEAA